MAEHLANQMRIGFWPISIIIFMSKMMLLLILVNCLKNPHPSLGLDKTLDFSNIKMFILVQALG